MERPEIFPLKAVHPMALLSFVEMPDDPGAAQMLLTYLQQAEAAIPFVLEEPTTAGRNLMMLVEPDVLEGGSDIRSILKELGQARELVVQAPVTMIRIFGPHFDIRPGLAAILFGGLYKAGVDLLASSTTITSTLLVAPEAQTELLLRVLRGIFRLPKSV
jgi:aspartokinase